MTEASHPSESPGPERRGVLKWIALGLGGLATAALATPIVGFFLSPLYRRENDEWVPVGPLKDFPENQTVLRDFKNPHRRPWDGETQWSAAYVRRGKGNDFTVFSINCAHLGCPVTWFPGSKLFMCPCHGGVYYGDGSRASGPPPRGLFEYRHKVEKGRLWIFAGHLPTLHQPLS